MGIAIFLIIVVYPTIFALAGDIGYYRCENKAAPKYQQKHCYDGEPIKEHQARAHEYHHREDEKKFWKFSIGGSVATLIMAGGALAIAGFTFNDAHEALISVQRAFVFEDNIKLMQPFEIKNTKIWNIAPEWENNGNTQTVNLQVAIACINDYFSSADPLSIDKKDQIARKSNRLLGPKQKVTGGLCTYTSDDIEDINNGNKIYYIVSIAQYEDVFGKRHITENCVKLFKVVGDYGQTATTQALQLATLSCETYTCADDQCGIDRFGDHHTPRNWLARLMTAVGLD